jgi:hypothetical protein
VTGAVRVNDRDQEISPIERHVVVAAVPEDNVRFLFGLTNDHFVIDTGVNHDSRIDVRLVLLALLDRAFVLVEIAQRGEALAGLFGEVAVRHGMTDRHHLLAHRLKHLGDPASGLRFPATGANGTDGDHRLA